MSGSWPGRADPESCEGASGASRRQSLGQDRGQLDDRRAVAGPGVERGVRIAEPSASGAPEPFHADPNITDGALLPDRREPLGSEVVRVYGSAAVRAAVEVLEDRPVDGGDAVPDHIGHHRCDRDGACHAIICALERNPGRRYKDCPWNFTSDFVATHRYSSISHSKTSIVK